MLTSLRAITQTEIQMINVAFKKHMLMDILLCFCLHHFKYIILMAIILKSNEIPLVRCVVCYLCILSAMYSLPPGGAVVYCMKEFNSNLVTETGQSK